MERIDTNSDKRLFGEYAVLAVGLKPAEQKQFVELATNHSEELKVVFGTKADLNVKLGDILAKEHLHGMGEEFSVPVTIVMSGFKEKEVAQFIQRLRQTNFGIKLLAVLTETSSNWKLKELLAELVKEAMELSRKKKKRDQP